MGEHGLTKHLLSGSELTAIAIMTNNIMPLRAGAVSGFCVVAFNVRSFIDSYENTQRG